MSDPSADVVLVSMPWTNVRAPSIQIGIVKAVLDRHGIRTQNAHLYVDFFEMLSEALGGKRQSVSKFESFGQIFGEWVFAVPPFRAITPAHDDEFRATAPRGRADVFRALMPTGSAEAWVDAAFRVRAMVPAFLERCAADILARGPRVVGFSTTFTQNVPSLALSKVLKQLRPDLRVVFGGANCEGSMGEALLRAFSWIDVVVRGESEGIAPALFRELLAGEPVGPQPGLCVRTAWGVQIHEQSADAIVPMDDIPLPVYDDYFERLRGSSLQEAETWLPYESARGCWWALRSVCTFCAANAQLTSYRSKSPDRVLADVRELVHRHGRRRIWVVDNILDQRYLREVFPELREQPVPMFVEIRAHLSKEQLRTLKEAGVVMVQPGIESLSTSILTLMRKGTTALQAVRLIKWCAELGIEVFYNLIYGFPQEPEQEYERMADAVLSLTHLQPPNPLVRLRLDRFSAYHRDPAAAQISILGPYPGRQLVYDLPADQLEDIEQSFHFRYDDGRNPDIYVTKLVANCTAWRDSWQANFRRLSWHRRESGLRIYDTRSNTPNAIYELDEIGSAVYDACNAGASAATARNALPAELQKLCSLSDVEELLEELTRTRLMFADHGGYVALAVEGDDQLLDLHERQAALPLRRLATPSAAASSLM